MNHSGDMSWRALEGMRRVGTDTGVAGHALPVSVPNVLEESRHSVAHIAASNALELSRRLADMDNTFHSPRPGKSAVVAGYGADRGGGALRTAGERISEDAATTTPRSYGVLVPTVEARMSNMPGWHRQFFKEFEHDTPEKQIDAYVMHRNAHRYQPSIIDRANAQVSQPWVKWTTSELLSSPTTRRGAPSPGAFSPSDTRDRSPRSLNLYQPSPPTAFLPYATGYGARPAAHGPAPASVAPDRSASAGVEAPPPYEHGGHPMSHRDIAADLPAVARPGSTRGASRAAASAEGSTHLSLGGAESRGMRVHV